MNLPIYLQPGQVLIYGAGLATGVQNIQVGSTDLKFGTIQMVWNYGNINAMIGDSILFKEEDVVCRLAYNNYPYTLIEESKIIITEQPVFPLP